MPFLRLPSSYRQTDINSSVYLKYTLGKFEAQSIINQIWPYSKACLI